MSSPLLKLQEDGTAKLNAEAFFATINVLSVRKLQIQSEIDQQTAFLTAKAGKSGACVLVGMPSVTVEKPNPDGPQYEIHWAFSVMENPTINMDAANGTLLSAEEIASEVLEAMHGFQVEGLCAIYSDQNAIQPNTSFEGLVAYDINVRALMARSPRTKTGTPTIFEVSPGVIDFVAVPGGATLYWTADQSLPWSGAAAPHLYAGAPFDLAAAGIILPATIRWAAYKANQHGSDIGQAVIS